MKIDYRILPLKMNHYKSCVELLNEQWQLGKKQSRASGNICAWIYMFRILRYSDKLLVCIDNKKNLGFVGYLNYKNPMIIHQRY